MLFSNTMARKIKEDFFKTIVTNWAISICLSQLFIQIKMKIIVKLSKNQGRVIYLGRREEQHRRRD